MKKSGAKANANIRFSREKERKGTASTFEMMLSVTLLGEWKRSGSLPESLCFEAHALPSSTSRKFSQSEKEKLVNQYFFKNSLAFYKSK